MTGGGHLRAAVVAAFPDLAGAHVRILNEGWDCVALDVDDRLIFKFPRNALAEAALRREAGLLEAVRPHVTMRLPAMELHRGPPMFSRHVKIAGRHLLAADYALLPEAAKRSLARKVARFLAELHALDLEEMRAVGALSRRPCGGAAEGVAFLPSDLRPHAEELLRAPFAPEPLREVFGHFDAHGWNMAFDHDRASLNGIYDFGDCAIGPLHHEFVQPALLGRDFVTRLLDAYEAETGLTLDRDRIHRMIGLHRLAEIGETATDSMLRPRMIRSFADWVAGK